MSIQDELRAHPAIGGLVAGATIGAGTAGIVNVIGGAIKKARAKRKTKTSKKRTTTTRKKRATTRKPRKSSRKSASKKIYKTKNGQPYIKLASGKARFISKKSATARRKRKGGYY